MPAYFDTPIHGNFLKLEKKKSDQSSIQTILTKFFGTAILFCRCDGFYNTLIYWLSHPDADQGVSGPTFAAESVDRIFVKDGTNFASSALRRLIEVRNCAASERRLADPTYVGIENIHTLKVGGVCSVLEPEDAEWFMMNSHTVEVYLDREEPDRSTMHVFNNIKD